MGREEGKGGRDERKNEDEGRKEEKELKGNLMEKEWDRRESKKTKDIEVKGFEKQETLMIRREMEETMNQGGEEENAT